MSASPVADHWLGFYASIAALNAYMRPRVLRKYQSDILNDGHFTVTSPISGVPVRVDRGLFLGERIYYLLSDNPRQWLMTGPLQHSSPLSELVTELDGQSQSIGGAGSPAFHKSNHLLRRLRKFRPEPTQEHRNGPVLLIGHPNFAHHLWNELSALDHWLLDATDERISRLSIIATAEPLGSLELIFPRFSRLSKKITRASPKDVPQGRAITRVGSRLVTTSVRTRIQEHAREHACTSATSRITSALSCGTPRVWVSVRLGDRTAENLEEFLCCLFVRLFLSYEGAIVLLDGFSFPVDFFEDPRTYSLRAAFTARANAVGSTIDDLCARVQKQITVDVSSRLLNISGIGITESIALGSQCDYYICHAGTLQHKVAWFHNLPGLIHLPSSSLSRARWHAAQVEDGVVPDIFPSNLISLSHVREMMAPRRATPGRNMNYRFVNIPVAVDFAMNAMRTALCSRAQNVNDGC